MEENLILEMERLLAILFGIFGFAKYKFIDFFSVFWS